MGIERLDKIARENVMAIEVLKVFASHRERPCEHVTYPELVQVDLPGKGAEVNGALAYLVDHDFAKRLQCYVLTDEGVELLQGIRPDK